MNKQNLTGFVLGLLLLSNVAFAQTTQTNIANVISQFKQFGIFDFYLPFLIVFALMFGILQRAKIFSKGLAATIALAAAGFVMIYTPAGITLAGFFANFFAETTVVLLTLIVVAVFMSLIMATGMMSEDGMKTWVKDNAGIIIFGSVSIFILLGISIFVSSGGLGIFPGINFGFSANGGGLDGTTWALIILLFGTGLIVFLVSRDSAEKKPSAGGQPAHQQ